MNKHKLSDNTINMPAIELAISLCGSEGKLAMKCDVKQQTVNYWRKKGRVPAKHILAVEQATNGKVTREQLLSDLC